MLKVYPIPALKDNYFWLIQPDITSRAAFIVDPGAAQPVKDALTGYNLDPKGILVTHHHHDHTDGIRELQEAFNLPVYGPDSPKIPQVTHIVAEGDDVKLGPLSARVLVIPGHTLDHIAYYLQPDNQPPQLFSGDTLFGAGCGRLFDGTGEQLFASLNRIANLPDDTLIYAAHEYTLANIHFALHIEPDNSDLKARQQKEEARRQSNTPTLPTQLLLEKRTNPFLRCHLRDVRSRIEVLARQKMASDVDIFINLRRAKDLF